MKFETLLLKALFASCLLVCAMTFGAMVSAHSPAPSLIASHAVAAHAASQKA
ncbi:hypothetical protein [Dyella caseinilytica]|uniref:Uncharacterized protein n=1 Tax=Dyella caseinilytica TaxID=1849581 RepID=A0ABX7GXS7_9GAMM|nr:hypothetical protein [Dyella caseinilytica]QRN54781.1 hypothetical protein ISN74_05340 [Dyella caseinilytica]GFZ96797.1 hypothetical protein GCM10011408_16550 [Dyella caseinilytica]